MYKIISVPVNAINLIIYIKVTEIKLVKLKTACMYCLLLLGREVVVFTINHVVCVCMYIYNIYNMCIKYTSYICIYNCM